MTTTCGPVGVSFVKDLGADEIVDISGESACQHFCILQSFVFCNVVNSYLNTQLSLPMVQTILPPTYGMTTVSVFLLRLFSIWIFE